MSSNNPSSPSTSEHYQTVEQAIAAYFSATRSPDNKVDAMVACFAPDTISYDPAEGPALSGREALRLFFQGIAQLFEEVCLYEDFVSINGLEAAVKWTGRGRSHSGQTVVFEGIDWFEIHPNGQIKTMKAYWNPAALLTELRSPPSSPASSPSDH